MCARVTSTYMEFTFTFGPKPEFKFSFNSIIIFRAICSFFIIIQFYCKNKCFLFYLQKSFGFLWDLWVIYEHLCSNLQFISLPEEVGEFLLHFVKYTGIAR